jgi:hypothetical protein
MAPSPKWTQSGTVETKKSKSQQQKALQAPEYTNHKQSWSQASRAQERRDAAKRRRERLGGYQPEENPSSEEVVEDEAPETQDESRDGDEPSKAHENSRYKEERSKINEDSLLYDEDDVAAENPEAWLYDDGPDPFDPSPQETLYWRNNP